jgi:hypothetical protein
MTSIRLGNRSRNALAGRVRKNFMRSRTLDFADHVRAEAGSAATAHKLITKNWIGSTRATRYELKESEKGNPAAFRFNPNLAPVSLGSFQDGGSGTFYDPNS